MLSAVVWHGDIERPEPGTGCVNTSLPFVAIPGQSLSCDASFFVSSTVRACSFLRSFCSLKITFRESNGDIIRTVEANEGDDILSIAHEYDIDLEGGSLFRCLVSLSLYLLTDPPMFDDRRLRRLGRLLDMPRHPP